MNPYAIPLIITAVVVASSGFTVYLRNPASKIHIRFSLFCLSMFIWLVGFIGMYLSHDEVTALWWARLGFAGVTFIPAFEYHFILTFLGLKQPRVLTFLYLLAFIGMPVSRTPLVYKGIWQGFWGNYPSAGPLYIVFPVMFACTFTAGVLLLFRALRREAEPIRRQQIKYLLLAFAGGTPGLIDYIVKYQINVYPFGYINALIFIGLIAFAIAKYRLMDVHVAITRGAIFGVVYALVLGVPFVLTAIGQGTFEYLAGRYWWGIPLVLMALLATAGHYLNLFLQRKADARLLREQRRYQATLMSAAKGMTQIRDLQRLLNLIVHILTRSVRLTHAAIFLLDDKTGAFVLQASRDKDVLTLGLSLDFDNVLVAWLKKRQSPLVSEEIRQMANGEVSPAHLQASLQRIEASVVVPSFAENELVGFLVLGNKKSGQVYSQDDLNVLQTLANQAALAIQNAKFFQELQTKTAELIHESKLKSMGKMASGMSHQINNRMACLVAEASSAREQCLMKLRAASSEAEREAVIRELEAKFDSICEEGLKGSTIVRTLLQFSRPTTAFVMTSLDEIIQGGLKMVSLKQEFHKLNLYVQVPKGHPKVLGNISQLQDVFFNLIDNACDAIQWKLNTLKRGALQVPESELPYQGEIAVIAKLSEDRTKHLITVADNGLGMTPEDADRLFLPFHTTKGTAEKGTGLGLFVIREMLKGHRGDIRMQKSEYGKGTTFLVELPVSEGGR